MNTPTQIPDGYKADSRGRLVPIESIKEIDLARDELVAELVAKAREINEALAAFRDRSNQDIDAFVDLSCEKYGVTLGGEKGNLTLSSYCGRYRVCRDVQETLTFDEKLKAAKKLVDECLEDWSSEGRSEIRTLVGDVFQVDSKGRINTKRVLSLRKHKFKDPRWVKAMEAIADSLSVAVSRSYIRIYQRDEKGNYSQLCLDLANA